jgi:hypothetical protein
MAVDKKEDFIAHFYCVFQALRIKYQKAIRSYEIVTNLEMILPAR